MELTRWTEAHGPIEGNGSLFQVASRWKNEFVSLSEQIESTLGKWPDSILFTDDLSRLFRELLERGSRVWEADWKFARKRSGGIDPEAELHQAAYCSVHDGDWISEALRQLLCSTPERFQLFKITAQQVIEEMMGLRSPNAKDSVSAPAAKVCERLGAHLDGLSVGERTQKPRVSEGGKLLPQEDAGLVSYTVADVRELLDYIPRHKHWRNACLNNPLSGFAAALVGPFALTNPTIRDVVLVPTPARLSEAEADNILAYITLKNESRRRFNRPLDVDGFDEMSGDVCRRLQLSLPAVRQMLLDDFVLALVEGTHLNGERPDALPLPANGKGVDDQKTTAGPHSRPLKKRSTAKGDGRARLIAALTKHHQFATGGCLNLESIGNNQIAMLAGVSTSTASAFFEKEFKGYAKYATTCRDASRLADSLKILNDEFSPHYLYGRRPINEEDRDNGE